MNEKGFVYFVRNGKPPVEEFRIGFTQNLISCIEELSPDEILNVIRCSNYKELCKELVDTFEECRISQSQFFRLTPDEVESVHLIIRSKSHY